MKLQFMKKLLLILAVLTLSVSDLWCQEVKVSNAVAKAEIASKETGQTTSTDTARIEDRYFFTANTDLSKYLENVPDEIIQKLRLRLKMNEICPSVPGKDQDCKITRDIVVGAEELPHFKIKPGFYVKGFNGFKQVYSGQVTELVYGTTYDEMNGQYYRLQMRLSNFVDNYETIPKIFVMSPELKDIELIQPLNSKQQLPIMDKRRLEHIKTLILNHYQSQPQLLKASHSELVPEVPEATKVGFPMAVSEQNFRDMPIKWQLKVLDNLLNVSTWDIMVKNQVFQIVRFGIDPYWRFSTIVDDKISVFYEVPTDFKSIFMLNKDVGIVLVNCWDGCYTDLLVGDLNSWREINVRTSDE